MMPCIHTTDRRGQLAYVGRTVALTRKAKLRAPRLRGRHWLRVAARSKSQLQLLDRPSAKLFPAEEASVIRYVTKHGDRRAVAEAHT